MKRKIRRCQAASSAKKDFRQPIAAVDEIVDALLPLLRMVGSLAPKPFLLALLNTVTMGCSKRAPLVETEHVPQTEICKDTQIRRVCHVAAPWLSRHNAVGVVSHCSHGRDDTGLINGRCLFCFSVEGMCLVLWAFLTEMGSMRRKTVRSGLNMGVGSEDTGWLATCIVLLVLTTSCYVEVHNLCIVRGKRSLRVTSWEISVERCGFIRLIHCSPSIPDLECD